MSISMFSTPQWDLAVFNFFNGTLRSGFLDWLMPIVSSQAWVWAGMTAAAIWIVAKHGPKWLVYMLLLGVIALASEQVSGLVKHSVGRVRPLNSIAGVHFMEDGTWQQRPADFVRTKKRGSSYYSAHASNSMALTVAVMLMVPVTRPWLLVLPLVVGWSRFYLGKHFPTDVLAGWMMGAIISYVIWRLYNLSCAKWPALDPGGLCARNTESGH